MDEGHPITASATLASELMFKMTGDDRVRAAQGFAKNKHGGFLRHVLPRNRDVEIHAKA